MSPPDLIGRTEPPRAEEVARLAQLMRGRRFAVLTGAGCSTESGIPDYRGPETRRRARNPIKFDAFMRSPQSRQRYWARALVGWTRFARKRPNPAHHALAALERAGRIAPLITQNVDRLHDAAGSREVIELHGALAEVRCMSCGRIEARDALQRRLLELNPGWRDEDGELAPDGDADLADERVAHFVVAHCGACDGLLKPNVVFFGEGVPRPLVDAAYQRVDDAEGLLVVGSSLAVFSGYRFVRRAVELGRPVALVNLGESRADAHADVKVAARAGELLPLLVAALEPAARTDPAESAQQQPELEA